MTEPRAESAATAGGAQRAGSRDGQIDWHAAAEAPEFKELVTKRRRFVLPATIFFLTWYLGFILLAGYAPDFMGEEFLTDGFTVGYALALTQFIMTWVITWLYLRVSDRTFDPLARKAAERAVEAGHRVTPPAADGTGATTGEVSPR
jgi:uncharacterized membrane protein (DUF485 family)